MKNKKITQAAVNWLKVCSWVWICVCLQSCQAGLDSSPSSLSNSFSPRPANTQLLNKKLWSGQLNQRLEPQKKHSQISLRINAPAQALEQTAFRTQALFLESIIYAKAWVSAPDIAAPIFNTGDFVSVVGNAFNLNIDAVPPGQFRVATIQGYDNLQNEITGARLKVVFHNPGGVVGVAVDDVSTAVGQIVETIITQAGNVPGGLDLLTLENYVKSMTGIQGIAPNFSFQTHPSLLNATTLATDLVANSGDVSLLATQNANYWQTPGKVTGIIQGLISNDTATIRVSDPASTVLANVKNGSYQIDNVPPGTWKLTVGAGSSYSSSTFNNVVVSSGNTNNVATVTLLPTTPTLTSLSSSLASIGSNINLNGNAFYPSPLGNRVTFNGIDAKITLASSTQLSVVVPPGISGTVPVQVQVGQVFSNTQNFTVADYNLSWNQTPGPGGGDIREVIFDPITPTTLYAATAGNTGSGVFKSTDNGATWFPARNGLTRWNVMALAVDPLTPTTLYAGTDGRLFKSTDGGNNWIALSHPVLNFDALAINPLTPSTVYAGTNNSVFKSTDSGGSWNQQIIGGGAPNISALAMDPSNPNTLYAGTSSGIYKTSDGGNNWVLVFNGDGNTRAMAVDPTNANIVYAATGSGVYKTIDGGNNWNVFNSGLGSTLAFHLQLAPSSPNTLFVRVAGSVAKSTDGGNNWNTVFPSLGGTNNVTGRAIGIHPTNANSIFVSEGLHLWQSTDGGSNYNQRDNGLTNTRIHALAVEAAAPTTTVYAASSAGLYRSTNSGSSWVSLNGNGLTLSNGGAVQTVATSTSLPNVILAGTPSGLYQSSDGGGNWGIAHPVVGSQSIESVVIKADGAALVGTDGNGFYRSAPGLSIPWVSRSSGLTDLSILDLAADPVNVDTIYAATPTGGVFKTTNNGDNWSAVNTGLGNLNARKLALDPATPTTLYVATFGGVYKSTDGGANWVPTPLTSLARSITLDPANPSVLYAGMVSGEIYKSTNKGTTWVAVNTNLPASGTNNNFDALLVVSGGRVYAGSTNSGVFKNF